MSLLYFGEYSNLDVEYSEFESKLRDNSEGENDTVDVKQDVSILSTSIVPGTVSTSISKPSSTIGYKPKSKKQAEKIGLWGERIVYNHLIESGKYELVIWKSENAKKAEVNPEGADGYGYDIEAIDCEGNHLYIEVKSTSSTSKNTLHFQMSDNEYNFATDNYMNYEIWYVVDVESSNPVIIPVRNPFDENGPKPDLFSVTSKSEYTFFAEIKQ